MQACEGRIAKIVSIHAPVKGATVSVSVSVSVSKVSIHAPVKGATPVVGNMTAEAEGFNPRPREGGDLEFYPVGRRASEVSIHAPVKGAT